MMCGSCGSSGLFSKASLLWSVTSQQVWMPLAFKVADKISEQCRNLRIASRQGQIHGVLALTVEFEGIGLGLYQSLDDTQGSQSHTIVEPTWCRPKSKQRLHHGSVELPYCFNERCDITTIIHVLSCVGEHSQKLDKLLVARGFCRSLALIVLSEVLVVTLVARLRLLRRILQLLLLLDGTTDGTAQSCTTKVVHRSEFGAIVDEHLHHSAVPSKTRAHQRRESHGAARVEIGPKPANLRRATGGLAGQHMKQRHKVVGGAIPHGRVGRGASAHQPRDQLHITAQGGLLKIVVGDTYKRSGRMWERRLLGFLRETWLSLSNARHMVLQRSQHRREILVSLLPLC
mmetsp:Transcript_41695/g.110346  ORF Transcript_41695/g.110346 Transcript_41695/m.110346 type:complete len:344 (+) Transcript_41695:540-1571(+)